MQVKRYLTQRGAMKFMATLKARYPHKLFRVVYEVGLDFRTRYHVETVFENGEGVVWVACGSWHR